MRKRIMKRVVAYEGRMGSIKKGRTRVARKNNEKKVASGIAKGSEKSSLR
jgi:hypothetical protein